MAQYGLIGEKLGHSFSKDIHEQIADYNYELMEMTSQELKEFMTRKDFKAVNITLPYKQEVIQYLDEMTDGASSIGAVNCVRNEDGKLIGHNTDFDGLKSLIEYLGVDIKYKWVLILGTGGTSDTAKAVCHALGADRVLKVSRSGKDGYPTYEDAISNATGAEIIINTTPCGMYPNSYNKPIDLDHFPNLEAVIDVVYNPLRTTLVLQALDKGVKAQGGLYMLTAQAVKASEFFLDTVYSDSLTEEIYDKLFRDKENIVLTGMPSSGKTTIGKLLAEKLGRTFIDTDALIKEKTRMEVTKIFEEKGESYFRNLETEVIKEASHICGAVIATGGGAVLRKENLEALKQNGKVFFIDRPLDYLIPTSDRPTASSKEQIERRYEERFAIYTDTADVIIDNSGTLNKAVEKILEEI